MDDVLSKLNKSPGDIFLLDFNLRHDEQLIHNVLDLAQEVAFRIDIEQGFLHFLYGSGFRFAFLLSIISFGGQSRVFPEVIKSYCTLMALSKLSRM